LKVAIHQAEHLPWFGYFHKIFNADIFIILDHVQFKKNYFENRNRIYTAQGLQYITLPVQMKGHINKKFYEIKLVENWKKKYIKTLTFTYQKAPFYTDVKPIIALINDYKGNKLFEINMLIIQNIMHSLNIYTNLILASELQPQGQKTELLIDILSKVDASSYIVGKSGFDYMNLKLFHQKNIRLEEHQVNHIKYTPFNYKDFTDYPSILDLIANFGFKKVETLIKNNKIV